MTRVVAMPWSRAKADRAVVLRTPFYFMSGFITEDAQQREILDCHGGNPGELWAVLEGMILEATNQAG